MRTFDSPADCVFFLFPDIYARARAIHVECVGQKDYESFTIQLVEGLYDGGNMLHPPSSYFTIMGPSLNLRVHTAIRDGEAVEVIFIHDKDERMRGMRVRKFVIAMVCVPGGGAPFPITRDDVDIFIQTVSEWALEEAGIVDSYQMMNFCPMDT